MQGFLTIVYGIMFFGIFLLIVQRCKDTVRSVDRTTRAIGKWNDEKLGKDD